MRLVSRHEFLREITRRGIVLSGTRRGYEYLAYSRTDTDDRFWFFPEEEGTRFLHAVLSGLGMWQHCWCWKRGRDWRANRVEPHAKWPSPAFDVSLYRVRHRIRPLLPAQFKGALLYTYEELPDIVAMALMTANTAWCVDDDLYLVPDHGQQILMVCHHEDVHVDFRDPVLIPSFVDSLAAKGFELPTRLREPGTPPRWMLDLRNTLGLGPHPEHPDWWGKRQEEDND
jgi:hypothetical protein